jgi:GTP-binding protein HflX
LERAIVVGIGLKSDSLSNIKEDLFELEELVSAAGGEVVGTAIQMVQQFNPATLIGSGKVSEVRKMVEESDATIIVFDHKLSGVQTRNLEKATKVPIFDRNQIILDIFAQRAQTFEGKLQVELAQLLDQMPRMVDAWMGSLSRQGGGIGTRGPGEKALEIDRRRSRERVQRIKKQLEDVRKNRARHRWARRKNKIPSFALIGYTNSGKSTLINRITQSDVHTKDQVFATLDPTTRKVFLPNMPNAVITDTVGFIRKLPPQLIEAFKATLEESGEADVLIHVVDLSSDRMDSQMETVNALIQEFGWTEKPIIHVYNKIDVASPERKFSVKEFPRVFVSAMTGEGIEKLREVMDETAQNLREPIEFFFSKQDESEIYQLDRESEIIKRESGPNGTMVEAKVSPIVLTKYSRFIITD